MNTNEKYKVYSNFDDLFNSSMSCGHVFKYKAHNDDNGRYYTYDGDAKEVLFPHLDTFTFTHGNGIIDYRVVVMVAAGGVVTLTEQVDKDGTPTGMYRYNIPTDISGSIPAYDLITEFRDIFPIIREVVTQRNTRAVGYGPDRKGSEHPVVSMDKNQILRAMESLYPGTLPVTDYLLNYYDNGIIHVDNFTHLKEIAKVFQGDYFSKEMVAEINALRDPFGIDTDLWPINTFRYNGDGINDLLYAVNLISPSNGILGARLSYTMMMVAILTMKESANLYRVFVDCALPIEQEVLVET